MAANKFATMLHRNTHKIIVILLYAVLEWVLICLLLLNSLFSYLIRNFAKFFGLTPPCVWCSTVDHILEPNKNTNSYRHLLCEEHATEISKLRYCPNHQKLAESQNMCRDCSSSEPVYNGKSIEISQRLAFFTWVSEKRTENDEKNCRCSCCDESLSSKLYPPYLLLKPSWGVLEYAQKQNLVADAMVDDNNGTENSDTSNSDCLEDHFANVHKIGKTKEDDYEERVADEHQILSDIGSFSFGAAVEEDCSRSVSNFHCDADKGKECEKAGVPEAQEQQSSLMDVIHQSFDGSAMTQMCYNDDESLKAMNLPLQNREKSNSDRLIPVELIDSATIASQRSCTREEDLERKHDPPDEKFDSEPEIETQIESVQEAKHVSAKGVSHMMNSSAAKTKCGILESSEIGEIENSSILLAEERMEGLVVGTCGKFVTQAAKTPCNDDNYVEAISIKETDYSPDKEEDGSRLLDDEARSKVMISIKVTGHETANHAEAEEPSHPLPCLFIDQASLDNEGARISTSFYASELEKGQGPKQFEKAIIQERNIVLVGNNHEGVNHLLSAQLEPKEVDEEKFLLAPTYMDGLHQIHKKLLLFEKREPGAEESWDGSVISEMEGDDGALTIERLKSALKAERKALSAVYAELEEERSAAAIAANQTMAMITRLQEEKAAMQMDALQYQRMMEEQSEYDQEALQLMNELMVKREKEKQELEKELEVHRKKVLDYEAKEKMMMRRKDGSVRSRNSSTSCSNVEDRDELSTDLNCEGRDDSSYFYSHQESSNNNTPDAVLKLDDMGLDCMKHLSTLDESLAEFEEERLSILEELKALEEKLFRLGDEEQLFHDVKQIEHFTDDYGKEFNENYGSGTPEENGVSNGFSEDLNEKHYPERIAMGSKAKRLLPLFDAIGDESEQKPNEEEDHSHSTETQDSWVKRFELENKKHTIEEEVDHVYERLQALEADREFLKHCINSLKKGDKGMDLLQEILQHLRDLRTVEFRVRNMGESPLVCPCT